MGSTINKYYIHQIYRNGVFLGVLPQGWVTSQFGYAQDINAAGVQLSIELDVSADLQREAPQVITTESGDPILTENGDTLITERSPDLVGNANSQALIRNNNDILVYEISSTYPNGKLVFSGFISRFKANFGSSNKITLSCLSNGQELDNYLIQGVPTLDQSQTNNNNPNAVSKGATFNNLGQTFTTGALATNVSAIVLKLAANNIANPQTATVKLWASLNDYFSGAAPLGSVSQLITSTTPADYTFTFPTLVPVSARANYAFTVEGSDSVGMYVGCTSTTSGGYINSYSSPSYFIPIGGIGPSMGALYFKTYYGSTSTSTTYSSQDPTAILTDIIDRYVSRGGSINYAVGSTVLTNTTRTYTFKVNTVLEGIKKCLDLAPYNWYWYVDPATNVIYFKSVSTTADHTMILGKHIEDLDLEATVENVKNDVYFTGGDVGGNVNLYLHIAGTVTQQNANAGRIGLARLTDNRVTLSDTAQAIANNFLAGNVNEFYNTTISIIDGTYDITLFAVGQVIGFAGFGNFVDNLLLQIVHIDRQPDRVVMRLGAIPQRASTFVEEIQRRLSEVETLYNPTSPS